MKGPRPGEGVVATEEVRVHRDEIAELAARAAHARTFRVCGRTLRIRSDDPSYLRRFVEAFRHLAGDAVGAQLVDLVFLTRGAGPAGHPALLDPANSRATVFAHESIGPTQLFANLVIDGYFPVDDRLVLHASVLERGGGATVFLGRTHAGKTTLALALALGSDVRFLSDEYAPVRIEDGFVEPFPRVLGVRPWTRRVLEARGARLPEGEGQVDVDPASIPGFELGSGGPVRSVVLVAGEAGEPVPEGVRDLDLEFVDEALLAALGEVPGVRGVEPRPERAGFGHLVRVHVDDGVRVTEALLDVCRRHGMQLHGLLPPGARRPDFREPPALAPLEPFRGLLEAVRHLVNRASLAGDMSGLMDRAAAALRGARFFRLRPGPLEETADLVLSKVL